jgi:hypothetical protein
MAAEQQSTWFEEQLDLVPGNAGEIDAHHDSIAATVRIDGRPPDLGLRELGKLHSRQRVNNLAELSFNPMPPNAVNICHSRPLSPSIAPGMDANPAGPFPFTPARSAEIVSRVEQPEKLRRERKAAELRPNLSSALTMALAGPALS